MRLDTDLSRRGTATTEAADPRHVAGVIQFLYERLAAAPHLRPAPDIDRLFRQLVELAVTTPAGCVAAVLADPAIDGMRPHLVGLSAQGEYELELAWAERIASGPQPHAELARFPYLENYQQLIALEHATLARWSDQPPRKVLFVGSGPLPLSSLLLARRLGVPVDSLDRDPAALRVSQRVAARLGAGHLAFLPHDLASCPHLSDYDIVVLAALVGLSADEKRRNLAQLQQSMAPGALLLARSAHGLKTLLYPEVDLAALDRCEVLSAVHPVGEVINSIVLARVR